MTAEPFHETCIAVRAGMLTARIRIDYIVIDLGYRKNRFCLNFFDDHSYLTRCQGHHGLARQQKAFATRSQRALIVRRSSSIQLISPKINSANRGDCTHRVGAHLRVRPAPCVCALRADTQVCPYMWAIATANPGMGFFRVHPRPILFARQTQSHRESRNGLFPRSSASHSPCPPNTKRFPMIENRFAPSRKTSYPIVVNRSGKILYVTRTSPGRLG